MLQANITREDMKGAVCGLTPGHKLDPVMNQSRASSVHQLPSKPAILAKPRTFKGLWPQKYPQIWHTKGSLVNGYLKKKLKKKLSDTLVRGHTTMTTMACNSNYVTTVDSNCWLSLKNSPHQTMCANMEEELLRRIAANRRFIAKIA